MKSIFEDINELEYLIKNNYIKKTKHPFYNIFLYSYTKKASVDALWNKSTLISRGLILDKEMKIISRPFKKFFEISQLRSDITIPYDEEYKVFEKLDGSLLISYWVGSKLFLATKGKFDSYQAIVANKILHNNYSIKPDDLNRNYTYVFELISPKTTNIVYYGNLEELFLLDIIDNRTGKSVPLDTNESFKKVREINIDIENAIKNKESFPEEGYVVKFKNDFRLKIKKDTFKQLYKKNQVYKNQILKNVSCSKPLSSLLINKNEHEVLILKDLFEKVTNLMAYINFYLNSELINEDKLEIIEKFINHYGKENKKLKFLILKRLFMTSQYYSLETPYSKSFLKNFKT